MDEKVDVLYSMKPPGAVCFAETLSRWVISFILPLDKLLGAFFLKHKKSVSLSSSGLKALLKQNLGVEIKLKQIEETIDSRDKLGFKYVSKYFGAISETTKHLLDNHC
jgi:hypothetical protein